MPVEIDEIVISVEVGSPSAAGGPGAAPATAVSTQDERQALVRECVEQVLQILRDREEP